VRLHPLVLSPRYPRYLNALLAPAALVVAVALAALWRRSRLLVAGVLIAVAAGSIREAREQHQVWVDAFSDARHASRILWELPARPIFSDEWFCNRYRFDGGLDPKRLAGRDCTNWVGGVPLTDVVARHEFEKLRTLPPGYVVTGGSRVLYANLDTVLQIEDGMVPPGWRLIREIPSTPARYRRQPLRIWEIVAGPDDRVRVEAPSGP
jgi:hypothetical protein